MPGRVTGVRQVKAALAAEFAKIRGPDTEAAITEALIIGGGRADTWTPIATAHLLNSRFREVERDKNGWVGRYGYTADYAAAVHALSGKLKGEPRSGVDGFTTRTGRQAFAYRIGNFWDPMGRPQWLAEGFAAALGDIRAAIFRRYKR